jgi:hypothetical protein
VFPRELHNPLKGPSWPIYAARRLRANNLEPLVRTAIATTCAICLAMVALAYMAVRSGYFETQPLAVQSTTVEGKGERTGRREPPARREYQRQAPTRYPPGVIVD